MMLSSCSSIARNHCVLRYNIDNEQYEVLALQPISVNDQTVNKEQGFISLSSMDKIHFFCPKCYMPHLYYFILPTKERNLMQNFKDNLLSQQKSLMQSAQLTHLDEKLGQMMKKQPDKNLQQKWVSMEKESLKKYLLMFGYGRWSKIRKYSKNHDKILKDKPDIEMKAFANDFIRTLFEYLQTEKNELRNFLINLIDEKPDDPFVQSQPKDWGELISQRATPWAKRLQLLYRVKQLIETYKVERKKYLSKPEDERDPQVTADYEKWNNLLNFLPASVFYGQRPSVWWTLRHDNDLLYGTYKYGYANYQAMRADTTLSFHKSEQVESQYQEFPNADNITRRLKKLVSIIGKSEYQSNLTFEKAENIQELSGYTLEEKNIIYELLVNFGVPVNADGKNDYAFLRSKLTSMLEERGNSGTNEENKEGEKNTVQNLERFVQRLRMVSQQIIQEKRQEDDDDQMQEDESAKDQDKEESKKEETTRHKIGTFDPDEDGFNFGYEKAQRLHKNMNILQFIRQTLLPNNCKVFEQGVDGLQEQFDKEKQMIENEEELSQIEDKAVMQLPDNWSCYNHDKNLLIALSSNGFDSLENLSGNKEFGFEDIEIHPDVAFKRIEEICEFYKDYQQQTRVVKKPKKEGQEAGDERGDKQGISEPKRKITKVQVQKDEQGNVIYPIIINSSLQVLDLGYIECERILYHTEKNLFPIGFKSLREHNSQNRLGERTQYMCEILDGGSKPQYKVTPMDDPENHIIRDSSTGCWIDICKRINELQGNKRTNVTVSGPERYGLADINVIRLLQQLPNAEKCSKYTFR